MGKAKSMNEIVKIHNDLADLPLRGFNPSEIDILMAICYKCQDEGGAVTLNIEDIKSLADYKAKDEKRFYEDLSKTVQKLNALNIRVGESLKEYEQFTLFPKFRVSEKSGTVEVRVAEDFQYMLNEFTGNYTRLELQQSVGLISKYSKQIYKMLRKFRSTGKWIVRLEDFREYLDIPKSYRITNIDQFVINPAIAELTVFFKDLSCNKNYSKKTGKGRPKVIGYEWTFKPVANEKKPTKQTQPTQESISEVTGWIKTGKFCPLCHRPVYKKQFENENGIYWMYGHADWKTGKCNFKTYDIADLIEEHQLREPEPASAEQRENKKKLGNLIGNLFK